MKNPDQMPPFPSIGDHQVFSASPAKYECDAEGPGTGPVGAEKSPGDGVDQEPDQLPRRSPTAWTHLQTRERTKSLGPNSEGNNPGIVQCVGRRTTGAEREVHLPVPEQNGADGQGHQAGAATIPSLLHHHGLSGL